MTGLQGSQADRTDVMTVLGGGWRYRSRYKCRCHDPFGVHLSLWNETSLWLSRSQNRSVSHWVTEQQHRCRGCCGDQRAAVDGWRGQEFKKSLPPDLGVFFTLNIPAARGSNPARQSVHSNFNMTKSYLLSNIFTLHEIKGNKWTYCNIECYDCTGLIRSYVAR